MGRRRGLVAGVMWVAMMVASVWRCSAQHRFHLVHAYSHLDGSTAMATHGRGMSSEYYRTLREHDQRRLRRILPEVVAFPISGDDDTFTTGLYYTRIYLGTPPQQFYVHVDTGSDVAWVNCVPCTNCKRASNVALPISIFDPEKSTSKTSISCTDEECYLASNSKCSFNSMSCPYSTLYGDGSSTAGYLINDVLSFNQVPSGNSTATSGTARLTFGCGSNQTGTWLTDGLVGFGQAEVSLPSQLSKQNVSVNIFAHCLQGDNKGSGTLVIGHIREPGLVYTPIVPKQSHYNVELLNIGVSGTNVTTPTAFDLSNSGGVIMDSGTTLTYLVQPAYDQFQAKVISASPIPPSQISDSQGNKRYCFIYSGRIEGYFPNVTLYFAGGAAMLLSPSSYLYKEMLTTGLSAYCFSWLESTSVYGYLSYTIFGDNVLKDQLVVYDNVNNRIGWKNFDCTKEISVSSTATSMPVTVFPSKAGPPGAFVTTNNAHSNGASFSNWLITIASLPLFSVIWAWGT